MKIKIMKKTNEYSTEYLVKTKRGFFDNWSTTYFNDIKSAEKYVEDIIRTEKRRKAEKVEVLKTYNV